MSFSPKINTEVSPFAQLSHNANFYVDTVRYNQSSATWATEFNEGNNGYRFTGNGYIWGHMADSGNSVEICSFRIGNTTEPQYQWGHLNYGGESRVSHDDEFLVYGNSTQISIPHSSTGNTHILVGSESRTNIIRMEL